MSLHVFMVQNGWPELADMITPYWQEYCRKHGYKFHVEMGIKPGYEDVHSSFSKTAQVLDYYKKEMPDALWVVDFDMLITNFDVMAHQFVSAKHAITITKDINGLNSGSYFLSGFWTTKCELWLKTVLSLRKYTTSEQHAMWWIAAAYHDDTFYWPHPSFNSIDYAMYPAFEKSYSHEQGQWQPGDFLVHLPGMSLSQRIDLFPTYFKHILK